MDNFNITVFFFFFGGVGGVGGMGGGNINMGKTYQMSFTM